MGVRHGTHLSSLDRDCLAAWQPLLERFREEPFALLEIGVGSGASLRTWREWFPRARLVGFDARRIALDPPIANCRLAQGRQTDPAAFHDLLRTHQFRLIVDDGSRHPDDQLASFMTLFPWLPAGSLYICAGLADDTASRAEERPGLHGPAWFAALGTALTDASMRERPPWKTPALRAILRRITGVMLTRGSAVVLG